MEKHSPIVLAEFNAVVERAITIDELKEGTVSKAMQTKAKRERTDKQRLRREIVEMTYGQHRLGLVDTDEVEQVTLRMLGRKALPKEPPKAGSERRKHRSPR